MIEGRKARLLAEIKRYSRDYDELKPDDITMDDIRQSHEVGLRRARDIIIELAEEHPDKYKRILVRNPANGYKMYVLRCIEL